MSSARSTLFPSPSPASRTRSLIAVHHPSSSPALSASASSSPNSSMPSPATMAAAVVGANYPSADRFFRVALTVLTDPTSWPASLQGMPHTLIQFKLDSGRYLLDTRDNKWQEAKIHVLSNSDIHAEDKVAAIGLPGCTIQCTDRSLMTLFHGGRAAAISLLAGGHLHVSGDPTLIKKFQPLFKIVRRRMEADQVQVQVQSVPSVPPTPSSALSRHRPSFTDMRIPSPVLDWKNLFIDRNSPRWLHDVAVARCLLCHDAFGLFTRRHHCRLCGGIYCQSCSSLRVLEKRVCKRCFASMEKQMHIKDLEAKEKEYQKRIQREVKEQKAQLDNDNSDAPLVLGFPQIPTERRLFITAAKTESEMKDNNESAEEAKVSEYIIRREREQDSSPARPNNFTSPLTYAATITSRPTPQQNASRALKGLPRDGTVISPVKPVSTVASHLLAAPVATSSLASSSSSSSSSANSGLLGGGSFPQLLSFFNSSSPSSTVSRVPPADAPQPLLRYYQNEILRDLSQQSIPLSKPPSLEQLNSLRANKQIHWRLKEILEEVRSYRPVLPTSSAFAPMSTVLFYVLLFLLFVLAVRAPDSLYLRIWDSCTTAVDYYGNSAITYFQSIPWRGMLLAFLKAVPSYLLQIHSYHFLMLPFLFFSLLFSSLALYIYLSPMVLRAIMLFTVAFRVIGGYWWLKYVKQRYFLFLYRPTNDMTTEQRMNAEWDEYHDFFAQLVYALIIRLQGFMTKLGQFMSSRQDIMPPQYIKRLAKVQDNMPSSPYSHVVTTVERELRAPIGALFASFNRDSLASASIAQVHEAYLKDGTHVVVKVQHADVQRTMALDMSNMQKICDFVAWLEKDYDFRPIMKEWAIEIMKEMDFRNEVANMTEVKKNMLQAQIDVIIPDPINHLYTDKVLVMEFIEGGKITDLEYLDRYGIDREMLVTRVAQAYAQQMYGDGLWNGDPHAGNLLCNVSQVNGVVKVRPVLLDFGLTKRVSQNMKLAFARMVVSIASLDYGSMLQAFDEMGVKMKRENPLEDMKVLRFLFRDTLPPEQSRAAIAKKIAKQTRKMKAQPAHLRVPVDSWPSELVFFFRATLLLRGLCSALHVRLPYLNVCAPYAKASLLGRWPDSEHTKEIIWRSNPHIRMLRSTSLQEKVYALLTRAYEQGHIVGCQVCAFRGDEMIVNAAAGTMGANDPRPVTHNTLFNGFSTTKGLTAALAHILADEGRLDYDEPVVNYWSDFAANGKSNCTVAHALSHQAGLENAVTVRTTVEDIAHWEKMLALIALSKPTSPPPCRPVYHYLSFGWLVGGLVEKASGESFSELLRRKIIDPLRLGDEMFVGMTPRTYDKVQSRLATLNRGFAETAGEMTQFMKKMEEMKRQNAMQHASRNGHAGNVHAAEEKKADDSTVANEDDSDDEDSDLAASAPSSSAGPLSNLQGVSDPCMFNTRRMRQAIIPAANGHFTAHALAKFYASLALSARPGIRSTIPRIVSAERVKEMQRVVVSQESPFGTEVKFGLGLRVYGFASGDDGEQDTEEKTRYTAFGHPGLGGSFGFCDPATGLAVAVLVNRLTIHRQITTEIVNLICQETGQGVAEGGMIL